MLTSSTTVRELCTLLGTSYSKLHYVLYKSDLCSQYTTFEIAKKNGGLRTIQAPCKQLLYLQQRTKKLLDSLYVPHVAVHGFVEGRSVFTNASRHTRKQAVFNLDLEDFFHTINFGRVRAMLMAPPYSLNIKTATYIAQICCTNHRLPQGAPTSPVVSNMICKPMDRVLSKLASARL